jgi:uncharacterized protein (DUF1015 family)
MPEARPFVGLVYDTAVAGPLEALTTPPYDVISPLDQERFYRASPFNVVRLILSREGANGARSPDSADKYTEAASYLSSWRERGVLRSTPQPSVYPYELQFHLGGTRRRVRGLIAEVDLEPWGGSIVPHERTLAGPIEDRLNLLRAVSANLSPVYTLAVSARRSEALSGFLDAATSGPPALELADEEGTRHRLWIVPDGAAEPLEAVRAGRLMIADGHHRYTVALAHREEMRSRFGAGPWDAMMMMIVDARAEDPPVLPIHRVVTDGSPPTRLGERVPDLAEILATVSDEHLTFGVVELEDGILIHRVASVRGEPPTVCALHEQVLDRTPDIGLRFVPDASSAEAAVRSGQGRAAFFLPPTKVDRVWKLVAAGRKLPQKSTYFWPKPRTGLVLRPFRR